MMLRKTPIRRIVVWSSIVVFICLLLPFPWHVLPDWRIKVITSDGKPAIDSTVRQEWRLSSLHGFTTQEKKTNKKGEVVFSEQTVYLPIIFRMGLYVVDLSNFVGTGTPMGGYGIVEAESSTFFLQYVHGQFVHGNNGENTLVLKNK